MKTTKGVSLAEIVVACFVLSLLLVVSVKVLLPAMRAWTDGQQRAEITQGLLVTSNWIENDVNRCAPDSLKVTDEAILVMRCAVSQRSDSSNEFLEKVAYWKEDENLFRATSMLSEAETGQAHTTLEEVKLLNTKRRVASGVEAFSVSVPRPWLLELGLQIRKQKRSSELETTFSSLYAPLDPNVALATPTPSPNP